MSKPLDHLIKNFSKYSIIPLSKWFVGSSKISKSQGLIKAIAKATLLS